MKKGKVILTGVLAMGLMVSGWNLTEAAPGNAAAAVAAAAATDSKTAAVGLPNPLVPMDYEAIAQRLGFRPLILPRSAGYELTDSYLLAGDTAEFFYRSRYGAEDRRGRLSVRSAQLAAVDGKQDISGVYGADWKAEQFGATTVYIATLSDTSFAAHWVRGGYAFAATGENMNRWDFRCLVRDSLVDLTEHYYPAK